MKRYLWILILAFLFPALIFGKQPRYLNIIIISDLSDRNLKDKIHLSKYPMHYDLMVIKEVIENFKNNVKKNFFVASKDRICFVYLPENQIVPQVNESLMIDMNSIDIRKRRFQLDKLVADLYSNIREVYINNLNRKTIGADIWAFFKYDLDKYLINDKKFRNVVLLLTDGYLYFNTEYQKARGRNKLGATFMDIVTDRRKGFTDKVTTRILPIGRKFSNVEILMMGVDPIKEFNNREFFILKEIWSEWFESMKIRYFRILKLENSRLSVKLDVKRFFRHNN